MPHAYQKERIFFNPRSVRCSCCLDCYHCGRAIVVTRHALVKKDCIFGRAKKFASRITEERFDAGQCRCLFDEKVKFPYSKLVMKRIHTTIKRRAQAMPKKIQFEWELPETLVDELTRDQIDAADTIKAAAVLDWVRTHKLSLRRGAELLQMPYRAFLELMATHRVPSMDYEAGWVEREQHFFEGEGSAAPA
jgi:predicted HTH domain antitoxin